MKPAAVCVALASLSVSFVDSEPAPDPEKEKKMAAVNKVITMLDDLKASVEREGDAEAKSYNKFACFCKDVTAEKTDAIQEGEDQKASITAEINSKSQERENYVDKVASLENEIAALNKEIAAKKAQRGKERADYEKEESELAKAITAIQAAIKVLKASKEPSLAQLKAIAQTIRTAALLADAAGLTSEADNRALGFLQDASVAPEVPMEDYKFHSDSVIETLEKLLEEFRKDKATSDENEVQVQHDYDMWMQEQVGEILKKKVEMLATKKGEIETLMETIATLTISFTSVSAQLADDQQYLTRLAELCQNKAKTWDQRSQSRADELAALTAAIAIIKTTVSEKTTAATVRLAQQGVALRLAKHVAGDESSMEAIEAATESKFEGDGAAALSFLQLRKPPRAAAASFVQAVPGDGSRQAAISVLAKEGTRLKSPLLTALATRLSEDKFAKVKQLIEELIERLLKESEEEATQKGWCDKSIADAEAKRDHAKDSIRELNSALARAEAERDELTEALKVLAEEIKELEDTKTKATKMREAEKAENESTTEDAKAGLQAVQEAMSILKEYYESAAKDTVLRQLGPDEDMPDAGFDEGETYKGSAKAGGVIGMLEVIEGDFQRTISTTEKAEAQAEQEFLEFMRTTEKSLAAKTSIEKAKTKQKDDLEESIGEDKDKLAEETNLLTQAIEELLELQPSCVDTGMSYEERVARRQEEIAGLKKALCVLDNYSQYGPDAAGDAC